MWLSFHMFYTDTVMVKSTLGKEVMEPYNSTLGYSPIRSMLLLISDPISDPLPIR